MAGVTVLDGLAAGVDELARWRINQAGAPSTTPPAGT